MEKDLLKKETLNLLDMCDFKINFDKEIDKVLGSGYIDYSNYDFEENKYQLPKLILYLVLRKISRDYKPFDTDFMKKYKHLIDNFNFYF